MSRLPLISTAPLADPAMDYAFLRREGIRLLERLGGQLWTDFNTHDPGITILEQLCYALTDLAYRINYDIKDLLVSAGENPYPSLHSPAQVLTINPVTLNDFRKLVLDVRGVKNAWVQIMEKPEIGLVYDPAETCLYITSSTSPLSPAHREHVPLQGVYQVVIEQEMNFPRNVESILWEVNNRMQACRGLGQDFTYPKSLTGQPILVSAEIEVSAVEDPELLLTRIYLALADFISPRIRFYTLQEMLERGKRIDEIMNGPLLQHGFIDDDELKRLEQKTDLRASDLIQEIMNVEGVVAVNKISLSSENNTQAWYLKLREGTVPYLDIKNSLSTAAIQLTRKGVRANTNSAKVEKAIDSLQRDATKPIVDSERDIQLPKGRDRNAARYHSIQEQFPATYGIGSLGLPESVTPRRKAQAKQLRAYLMFFDQLLANYFVQLANAKHLFSFQSAHAATYFSQSVPDDGLNLIDIRNNDNPTPAEKPETASERKNRFLNHLLARFAEQFTDYSLLLYAQLQPQDLVDVKSAFLRDYKELGSTRGTGFNYIQPENISGLERRIRRKLGISKIDKPLADLEPGEKGDFYLLEHILLRPFEADRGQIKPGGTPDWQAGAFLAQSEWKDPYSHQVSFVFPEWVENFKKNDFAQLVEKTVREETPAHLRIYFHRLERTAMEEFESAYADWLAHVSQGQAGKPPELENDPWERHMKLRAARDRMVELLGLGVPYPLRDLRLAYDEIVTFDTSTTIKIIGGQSKVVYQLCDEDGNPIVDPLTKESFQVRREPGQTPEFLALPTPKIQKDISFTILAIREGQPYLESYLHQTVSFQTGINTELKVAFEPTGGHQTAIDYGSKVKVKISGSQEGISYRLITGTETQRTNISEPQKGNTEAITLISSENFLEDIALKILAYRTANWHESTLLKAELQVNVRPDTSFAVSLNPAIVDYGMEASISLGDSQPTAEYQLYMRELIPADYVSHEVIGRIEVKTDDGRSIYVKPPEKIINWNTPDGYVLVGAFERSGQTLSAKTGTIREDTVFMVRATKTVNGQSLQLDQAVVALARPDAAALVTVAADKVQLDTPGQVILTGTQKGVAYQLRFSSNGKPVNAPGYHVTDRGIETSRIGVDFVVGEQGDTKLFLPTGNITKETAFGILATKILTGVSKVLDGKATIGVLE